MWIKMVFWSDGKVFPCFSFSMGSVMMNRLL